MKKRINVATLVVMLVVLLTNYASTPVFAADDDGEKNPEWANKEDCYIEIGPPIVYYPFFSDTLNLDYNTAQKLDELAEFDAFKSIAKEGGEFKPNAYFTQKQFARIVKNIWGIKLTVSNPKKACTSKFIYKSLKKVAKKHGIFNYNLPSGDSTKMTRIQTAMAIYTLFDVTVFRARCIPINYELD